MKAFNHGTIASSVQGEEYNTIARLVPHNFTDQCSIKCSSQSGPEIDFTIDWGNGNHVTYTTSEFFVSRVPMGDIIVRNLPEVSYVVKIEFRYDVFKEIHILSDGAHLTSMENMCNGLSSLEVFTAVNTHNVQNFILAWNDCFSLTEFPAIDTSGGTYFSNTWSYCTGLTSFPLIDTSNATSISRAWYGCSSLTTFPPIDTSSATHILEAWRYCSSLIDFPPITIVASDIDGLWRDCTNLEFLPAIDFSAAANFQNLFSNCHSLVCLTEINTLNYSNTNNMFGNTFALVAPDGAEQFQIRNGFNYVNANPCP